MNSIIAYYGQPSTSTGIPVFVWIIIACVIVAVIALIVWLLRKGKS